MLEDFQETVPNGKEVVITYPKQADFGKCKAKNKGLIIGEPSRSIKAKTMTQKENNEGMHNIMQNHVPTTFKKDVQLGAPKVNPENNLKDKSGKSMVEKYTSVCIEDESPLEGDKSEVDSDIEEGSDIGVDTQVETDSNSQAPSMENPEEVENHLDISAQTLKERIPANSNS